MKYDLLNYDLDSLQEKLDFQDKVNNRTGECGSFMYADYNALRFKFFYPTEKNPDGRLTVEGSYHKYWNDGKHNFNDFSFNDFLNVLEDIRLTFGIDPHQCRLRAMEFGFNIVHSFSTERLLKGCLMYMNNEFSVIRHDDEGSYRQYKGNRMYVKLYDKRKHYESQGYQVGREILRIEKKYSKMHELNKLGIIFLSDLNNSIVFRLLKQDLVKMWAKVLFFDDKLLKNHKNRFKYGSLKFWESLNADSAKYHKRILKKIYNNSPESIHRIIRDRIENKFDALMKPELPQNNHLFIGLERDNRRVTYCRMTGLDISMQRKDSFLLSHRGLKHYLRNDKTIFNEVKNQFLTRKWINSDFDIQIRELAHNIRTRYNTKIKKRRQRELMCKNQYDLFSETLNNAKITQNGI